MNQFSIAVSFAVCVCLFVVHTHAGQAHDQSISNNDICTNYNYVTYIR